MEKDNRNAARTLDQIRDGGGQLVIVALERLRECEESLRNGAFVEAHQRAEELLGRLLPLAQAHQYLGAFDGSFIIRARDIQEGMLLSGWGRVHEVHIEHREVTGADDYTYVRLAFDGEHEDVELVGEREVIALR